jgi:hypothetical protein
MPNQEKEINFNQAFNIKPKIYCIVLITEKIVCLAYIGLFR